MRIVSGAAVALVLGLCAVAASFIPRATAESYGNWQVTTKVDSVTGAKIFESKA